MSFSLTNVLIIFQSYINQALAGYLDIICIVFLNDIIVYLERVKDYIEYVLKILEHFKQYSLYIKISKCLFSVKEVEFLRYIVGVVSVSIDLHRIDIIRDWPTPTIYYEIQIFIRFCNFYC
jgi:hypothetical protein